MDDGNGPDEPDDPRDATAPKSCASATGSRTTSTCAPTTWRVVSMARDDGAERVVVLGHSFGGAVAIRTAVQWLPDVLHVP